MAFGPVLEPSSLDGRDGFRINGEGNRDYSGGSMSAAGDVNGDGFDDVIVGANFADPSAPFSGASYVVFGRAGGLRGEIELADLDGRDGFQISGERENDLSGGSVSSAGDVNGDGFDDLVIGAIGADAGGYGSGAAYLVFGKAGDFNPNLRLSNLDGANGFRISGAEQGIGISVSGAGNVNGDGFGDVIVGREDIVLSGTYDEITYAYGEAYVVFGKAGGFDADLDLDRLNGRNGFRLDDESEFNFSGASVSAAGDVNGDGVDDLIVGAPYASSRGASAGLSYVVFGKEGRFAADFDLGRLKGGNGFRSEGEESGDSSGRSVSSAGDVNGDGFDDIVIGAGDADPRGRRSGATYVVFGAAAGFDASLDLSDLDGGNGFQISGEDAEDGSGRSVSAAGDVNGDGFADIIIGASGADPSGEGSGASYVVFGTARGFEAELRLSELDGRNGFQISGEEGDFSGVSVSGAGDIDGDGFDDLLVGATGADPNGTSSGTTYEIYGEATGPVSRTGTAGEDRLAGGAFDDRLSGAGGDDRLQGEAGDDLLRGGRGDDRLQGGNGDDRLRGDLGADVLNGADLFVFRSVAESSKDASDAIVDFRGADLIDLRKVDADPDRDGDQDFTFRDDRGFTGEGGEVTLRRSNGDTIVVADRDGDGRADLRIVLDGGVRLDADDFLL